MTKKVLDKDYWTGIVKTADELYQSVFNTGLCAVWCQLALKQLKEDGLEGGFVQNASTNSPVLDRTGLRFHTWVERTSEDGKRFIADGTAGQIDSSYKDGFYGSAEEAPESLRELYRL